MWGVRVYYVYMMTNWNNQVLYVGVTNNLFRRVHEHISQSYPGFTENYNLDKLVYFEQFNDVNQVIAREKQLKGWTREKKNRLVNSFNADWLDLSKDLE